MILHRFLFVSLASTKAPVRDGFAVPEPPVTRGLNKASLDLLRSPAQLFLDYETFTKKVEPRQDGGLWHLATDESRRGLSVYGCDDTGTSPRFHTTPIWPRPSRCTGLLAHRDPSYRSPLCVPWPVDRRRVRNDSTPYLVCVLGFHQGSSS